MMYSSEKTEKWFNDYVDSFRIEGELARMQELKRRHSFRVQRLASAIAESLEWREENDAWLARGAAARHGEVFPIP